MNEKDIIITPAMKISAMLQKYPETLEVLLNASPHFNKLNNTFLRKTLGARVTVEQAASIAGVSLPALIKDLNQKINININEKDIKEFIMDKSTPVEENKFNLSDVPTDKIIELDVRDDIKNGKDPIYKIKPAISSLKEDEILHLINSFEPVPLYSVLGNKGFDRYTEKIENVFHVYFFRKQKQEDSLLSQKADLNSISSQTENEIIEIDVRELAPPEPMMKILSILPQLSDGTVLLVHHHREPMMLYDKLEEKGFTAVSHKINDNYYKVVITKK